ncbi:MAG: hypothetical protein JG718_00415 [Candidatus Thiothrix moscowensis]|nr:hypothetical protein [Candidatus Thiothrix moscowensis]
MSDSQQLFDIVVLGHNSPQSVEQLVKDILNLLGDNSPYLEFKLSDALLFNNGMVSIRENISFQEAQTMRRQLATLGVECEIRPTLQLIPKEQETAEADTGIYTCPACGHQQPKRKSHQLDTRLDACEVCGIVGERYQRKQKLEQAIETERQRHENDRSKRIREVLERAKQEEESLLQAEARKRLGLAEKPDNIALKVAAAIAVFCISMGGIYYYNQPTPEEIAQQEEAARLEKAKKEEELAKTMSAAMEKASDIASKLENLPSPAGAAGAMGAEEKNAAEQATTGNNTDKTQTQAQAQEQQAKITEALKTDTIKPATPEEITEAKVKTEASTSAVAAIEEHKLTPPRFQIMLDEHTENRRRIQQLLKLDEIDLIDMVLEKAQEPYPRTLLLLDIVEWHLQKQQPDKAKETIERIRQELAATQDVTQQALILGCISKTHLLQNEWEPAGQSLQQALEKARTLPQLPAQVELLARLASEQSLFGNQIASRQILEEAEKRAETLPEGVEPRASAWVRLASGYAMLTDFPAANKLLDKVKDPEKRQKLAEFIDKLQHRVEQVRAEYQQAASTPH